MNSMRLPTKPGHTPTITGTLPIRLPIAIVVATTVSDDFAPRTFSSSFITLAGEKKCIPMTLSGREVTAAISLMSSAEVFEARIAPGLADLVELAEDRLLQLHVLEHRLDDDVAGRRSRPCRSSR